MINRIDQKHQNSLSCYHKKYCIQKYTTNQLTYLIYYLFQDNFKNAKMVKIQKVHQKIHAKQFFITVFKLFSIGDSFKVKAIFM